jgi:hypothetical protein
MQRGRLPRVIAQHAKDAEPIAPGTADRCAHVERVELRQFLEILLDKIGEREQQILPLERFDPAPAALESATGGVDRAIDILSGAFRNAREHLAGLRD